MERRIQGGIFCRVCQPKAPPRSTRRLRQMLPLMTSGHLGRGCPLPGRKPPCGQCAHVDASGMRWLPGPISISRSLHRHTSHARPSPRRIAAHKHARGHYLIVPPRRDNVDNIFSWLHQSLMRHQGSRQQVTWPQSEWHLGHKASNCCFCCCMSCCSV